MDFEEEFEYQGKLMTVKELADLAKVTVKTMSNRLDTYTSIEEAVHPSKRKCKSGEGRKPYPEGVHRNIHPRVMYEYNGKMYSIRELSEIANMTYSVMAKRLRTMETKKAIELPFNHHVYKTREEAEAANMASRRKWIEKKKKENFENRINRCILFLQENGFTVEKA